MGDCSTKQDKEDIKICLQFQDEGRLRVIREENRVERCAGNERRERR